MYGKTPVAITSQPVMLEDPVEGRDGGECPPSNPRGINLAQQQPGFPLSTESASTPANSRVTSPASKSEDAADVDRIATVFDDLNGYLSDTATTSLDYKIQTERRRRKKREQRQTVVEGGGGGEGLGGETAGVSGGVGSEGALPLSLGSLPVRHCQ